MLGFDLLTTAALNFGVDRKFEYLKTNFNKNVVGNQNKRTFKDTRTVSKIMCSGRMSYVRKSFNIDNIKLIVLDLGECLNV